MRLKTVFFSVFLSIAVLGTMAMAQDGSPPPDIQQTGPGHERRPNLLRELGLSPDQLQQLKRINQERRPAVDIAIKNLSDANRALDEAIYADAVNEPEVSARLKDVQDAQGELARIRFTNELAVRKLLTPEQLVRFRDLRRQFAETREKLRDERRTSGAEKPFRRMPKPVQE